MSRVSVKLLFVTIYNSCSLCKLLSNWYQNTPRHQWWYPSVWCWYWNVVTCDSVTVWQCDSVTASRSMSVLSVGTTTVTALSETIWPRRSRMWECARLQMTDSTVYAAQWKTSVDVSLNPHSFSQCRTFQCWSQPLRKLLIVFWCDRCLVMAVMMVQW